MKRSLTLRHFRASLLALLIFPALTSDAAVVLFGRTQQAIQTPFEPARNPDFNGGLSPFTSTDVQNAIEEAYHKAPGTASRYAVIAGKKGASDNKWIEFFKDIPSNEGPFILAETSTLKALSVSWKKTTTAQCDIYKNGTVTIVATLTTTAALKAVSTGLSVSFASLDEIRVFCFQLGGSPNSPDSPIFTLFLQTVI